MPKQCQRKFFYYELMAMKTTKDKDRLEAYFLKQLGSIHSWRGKVVDHVIENLLVPEFNNGTIPSFDLIKKYTLNLMEKQLKFAQSRKYRDLTITKKEAGDSYLALRELEDNGSLNREDIELITQQVLTALRNLLKSNLMRILTHKDAILLPQKRLYFIFEGIKILAQPDLIVYFKNKPPMIIDWKAYYHRNDDARIQLGVYAIALSEVNPIDPFQHIIDPTEIRLIEFQLLKDFQREYQLTQSDLKDIKAYILRSSEQIDELIKDNNYHTANIEQFAKREDLENCQYCTFNKLCMNSAVKYQTDLTKFLDY